MATTRKGDFQPSMGGKATGFRSKEALLGDLGF
jgi:hypothetical protein